jgi:hypothetical protein
MRTEFAKLIGNWYLDQFPALEKRIQRVRAWVAVNEPLQDSEQRLWDTMQHAHDRTKAARVALGKSS